MRAAGARGRARKGGALGAALVALWVAGCASTVSATQASGADAGLDASPRPDVAPAPDVPAIDAPAIDVVEPLDVVTDDGPIAPADDGPAPPSDVPGERCLSAIELRDGDVLAGERFDDAASSPLACDTSGGGARWPTRWYRATVPAGEVLEVDVGTERGGVGLAGIEGLASCDATTCLAQAITTARSEGPLLYRNEGAAPRSVAVAVALNAEGTATVAAHLRPPADNATCATATPLADGVTLRGQAIGRSIERARSCLDASGGPGDLALYYAVTVPPRTAFVATAHDTGTANCCYQPHVLVQPPCGDASCLPLAFEMNSAPDPTGQFNNASDAARPVTVAVTANDGAPLPTMDVSAAFRALAPNAVCAAALPLVDGVVAGIEHPEDATDATPSCPGAADVPPRALYYAIEVPAGQSLTVTADQAPLTEPATFAFVRLFTGCGGMCLAASVGGGGLSPRAVYVNEGTAAQRVVVAVGSVDPGAAHALSLRATLRPTSANLTCAGALPLPLDVVLRNVDLLEAQATAPCASDAGPVIYYTVPVTPGSTLTVRATRGSVISSDGPTVLLVESCGGACLAQSHPSEALTYVNHGAARTLLVAVGEGAAPAALVTLTAHVEPAMP